MAESVKAFLSGGFGGMCLVFVGHPLDTVKVKLQTSNEFTGMLDCFKKTIAKDGVRGLYAGMAAPLAGIAPIFAVYFWGFEKGKDIARYSEGVETNAEISTAGIVFAGGFSSLPGSLVMVPGDRIKVILQSQSSNPTGPQYNGPIDAFKGIYREDGVRGLYRGTALTLLRDTPGSMAYYSAYEIIKRQLPQNSLGIVTAGGLAGMFNWLVAVPADVLKSRYQIAPKGTYPGGLRQVASELIEKEGITSLYKGLGPALARAIPANAACFLGVETSRKFLDMYF